MSTADPILAARTITELMVAIDSVYHLGLPTSIPPGGLIGELWAAGITVSKGGQPGVLYEAEGTATIPVPPVPPVTVFVRLEEPGS